MISNSRPIASAVRRTALTGGLASIEYKIGLDIFVFDKTIFSEAEATGVVSSDAKHELVVDSRSRKQYSSENRTLT